MPKASEPPPRWSASVRTLLDVNVLVALLDDAHVFSRRAYEWLGAGRRVATCPLVENGVIRIMSAPGYSEATRATPELVAGGLRTMVRALDHEFWPDDVSLLDDSVVDVGRLHGHRQITDAYLLALAVRHDGALASFDQGVPLSAVRGAARRHLLVP